ncbi:MAG: hypothetical protein AAFR11_05760 [Pseudomonadota bacterium]
MAFKRPPYYRVRRNNRAFFELGKERAAESGMPASTPLGQAGPSAEAAAWSLYSEYRQAVGKADPEPSAATFPNGSVGAWFEKYQQTASWAKKGASTREEWRHCWEQRIRPAIGERRMNSISPAEAEALFDQWEAESANIRWRTVKIARALFNAAIKHHVIDRSPWSVVQNSQPPARQQFWRAPEIAALRNAARAIGKPAMALAIGIGWEAALQPVDVRALSPGMLSRDGAGGWFDSARSKTKRAILAAITAELLAEIDSYVASLGVALPPDAPILRTSRDAHEYTKTRFIADFDLVRKQAFGDDERRRFQDIRRSANLEAALGAATPEERAAMLANDLDKDKRLDRTYTPRTVEKARQTQAKRLEGRRLLAGQSVNATGESGN